MDQLQQVENIAKAFYEAQDSAQPWDNEPDIIKESFRTYARDAIALLDQQRQRMLRDSEAFRLTEAV